ncbi:MAG: macro domain-containing protein [Bacilli bacterium]|nr:macro domain-containing protein [Bacilli bacterium]
MDKSLDSLKAAGLLDVIEEWIKEERFVNEKTLQESFWLSEKEASLVLTYLIKRKLVEDTMTSNKGYRVVSFDLGLQIYLLDIDKEIIEAWKKEFEDYPEVEIVHEDFKRFMDTHDVEAVVSPANAYGSLSGGYDLAIRDYFGVEVEREIQKLIRQECYGEQPVATSLSITIPGTNKKLIHTPTMQTPSLIKDPFIVYQAMRVTLMEAIRLKVKSIVIPAFGGATGRVAPKKLAELMRKGYEQIISHLG